MVYLYISIYQNGGTPGSHHNHTCVLPSSKHDYCGTPGAKLLRYSYYYVDSERQAVEFILFFAQLFFEFISNHFNLAAGILAYLDEENDKIKVPPRLFIEHFVFLLS